MTSFQQWKETKGTCTETFIVILYFYYLLLLPPALRMDMPHLILLLHVLVPNAKTWNKAAAYPQPSTQPQLEFNGAKVKRQPIYNVR